jgi:Pentapeptide repeats (8 copies).
LQGANLFHTDLRSSKINSDTNLDPKWLLVWRVANQRTAGQDLTKADFSGANFEKVNLEGLNMEQSNFNKFCCRKQLKFR